MLETMKVYTIVDEFTVKDRKIAALNEELVLQDYNTKYILVDGKKMPYSLTHHKLWIILQTDEALLGKEITFST